MTFVGQVVLDGHVPTFPAKIQDEVFSIVISLFQYCGHPCFSFHYNNNHSESLSLMVDSEETSIDYFHRAANFSSFHTSLGCSLVIVTPFVSSISHWIKGHPSI